MVDTLADISLLQEVHKKSKIRITICSFFQNDFMNKVIERNLFEFEEAEGWEFANILRSLKQFLRTYYSERQNQFLKQDAFLTCTWSNSKLIQSKIGKKFWFQKFTGKLKKKLLTVCSLMILVLGSHLGFFSRWHHFCDKFRDVFITFQWSLKHSQTKKW